MHVCEVASLVASVAEEKGVKVRSSERLKAAQICSNLLKSAQNCSKLLKTAQICSNLLKGLKMA